MVSSRKNPIGCSRTSPRLPDMCVFARVSLSLSLSLPLSLSLCVRLLWFFLVPCPGAWIEGANTQLITIINTLNTLCSILNPSRSSLPAPFPLSLILSLAQWALDVSCFRLDLGCTLHACLPLSLPAAEAGRGTLRTSLLRAARSVCVKVCVCARTRVRERESESE